MKTVMIVNPHAGKQVILKKLEEVQKVFEDAGAEVTVERTENPQQAEQCVRRAVSSQADVLVCCGGDGTLSETVSFLLEEKSDMPLGYIPAGTTNDFAASLHIPREPVKAAQRIAGGSPRILDVGSFGDRKFIYVASFGAFTQSSYSTSQNQKNSLGHFAYVLEGIKELPDLKSYHVKVETAEGESREGEYIFGAVSNSTSFGGMIKLDPGKVDMSDGKFELTLVKTPKNLLELNRVLFSLMSGKYDDELITFLHTEKAVFSCEEPMPWSLDGEYASGGERVEVRVLPQAVRIF